MPDDAPARMHGLSVPTGAEAVRGILLILVAYLVITGADVAVKWALPEVGVAVSMIARGVVGAAFVLLITRGRGIAPVNRRLLATRGLLHCAVSATWYWAWLSGMSLVDSYAIAAAAPLAMTLLAIPLLGERVGWRRWTSTAVGFTGVMFMLQPEGDLWRFETPFLLVAVIAMAVTRIWTRVLSATDGPAAVAFWLMVAHIPVGIALLPVFPPPGAFPTMGVVLALVFFGAANAIAHILFARAFALAPVSALAPYEYSPLLLGGILGFLIWAEVPAWTTITGAVIVIAAGLYNLHRERVRREAERKRDGGG
ncbi:DMT family transporter [Neoroseomonas rubea]|uniref:DMT family transporter n=1 Tax=Neoroseomonas rubea TaxID=2748666 RepID=UPI001E34F230|nr:DMT family transporter [Roseomonas rubea]